MLARDVMTSRVVSIYEKAPLAQAIELMLKLKISGLPVVDDRGELVGMLTEGDLLRRSELGTERSRPKWLEFILGPGRLADEYVKTHARRVEDVATRKVHSVTENTPLGEIVSQMNAHRVKRLPVVRGAIPVGIISRSDLVHALGAMLDQTAGQANLDDAGIKAKIAETLGQSWAPRSAIGIQVHDGRVDLRGVLTDERQHDAIRVAVENIPGVKAINDNLVCIDTYSGPFF